MQTIICVHVYVYVCVWVCMCMYSKLNKNILGMRVQDQSKAAYN